MAIRHPAIDAIRGACLINIFVNHLELGYLTRVSPSRMGFSDSSDLFVLLSGISTALSFAGREPASLASFAAPLWSRALRLYTFNLGIVASTLAVLGVILALRGPVGINEGELSLLATHGPWTLFWHGATLQQTVGYSCVLRLYMALLLLAPVLLRLSQVRWWAPLPLAVLVWLLAGQYRLVVVNSLTGVPYALTVLPWTLLFTIGICLGRAMTLGITMPRSRLALWFAVSYIIVTYLLLVLIAQHAWPVALEWIASRNDHFWSGASKTYLSPLRVLHVLSLVYVVMALQDAPVIRRLHRLRPEHGLSRLGRHSLIVFTLGAVLAIAGKEVLDVGRGVLGAGPLPLLALEIAIIGLYLSLSLWVVETRRKARARTLSPDAAAERAASPSL